MRSSLKHPLVAVLAAVVLTLPWLILGRLMPGHLPTLTTVALSGIAVLGSSFLLAWAAETAEEDVPRAFALAVLAVLAVAPEYAVDALYAFNAGAKAGTPEGMEAANLAVANMTGANRILIGLGWSGIALFTIYRAHQVGDSAVEERAGSGLKGYLKSTVKLDPNISTEILFLTVATIYAFFVPLRGSIGIIDMVFLVSLYVVYIYAALQAPHTEEEQIGVPGYFQDYPRPKRIATVLTLFFFAGAVILLAVEPFAHGLETLGKSIGIPPFLMIQWVAPLASESPELIVVAYLVNKARSTAGFNALISSKLNQWTLLIGTLVLVYSIGLGKYGALPLDQKQAGEIWLTAAQSYFALSILVNYRISVAEALALLVLFVVQLYPAFHHYEALLAFSGVYLVLGTALFVLRRDDLAVLVRRTRARIRTEVEDEGLEAGTDDGTPDT